MPQMGVSVAEGTIVAWRVAVGDADRGRADDPRDLDRQDRLRSARAGLRDARRDPGRARPDRRRRHGARPDRDRRRTRARSPPRPTPAPAPAAPVASPTRAGAPHDRRYSPVVQRIAAEHDVDLASVTGTGRGGRVRKQDVLALVNGTARPAPTPAEPPMHIESPYRPDPELPSKHPRRRRPVADAPHDRAADEAVARHRGDVHDLDRGRHVTGRGRPGARSASPRSRSSPARPCRRCASSRR